MSATGTTALSLPPISAVDSADRSLGMFMSELVLTACAKGATGPASLGLAA